MAHRHPQVPRDFNLGVSVKCSKSDLIEILWDVMIQSPWFDESTGEDNPALVADKVIELWKIRKESRK